MLSSVDKNLPRGNSRSYLVTVTEPVTGLVPDPDKIDLTGSFAVFEMKAVPDGNRLRSTDPVAVSKTTDNANEIEILAQSGDTLGQLRVKLLPEDTEFLPADTYAYSITITTAAGDVYTVAKGRIFLGQHATAAENQT